MIMTAGRGTRQGPHIQQLRLFICNIMNILYNSLIIIIIIIIIIMIGGRQHSE